MYSSKGLWFRWYNFFLCPNCYLASSIVTLPGLKRKLSAASKKADCELITDWIQSASNHVYWTAKQAVGMLTLRVTCGSLFRATSQASTAAFLESTPGASMAPFQMDHGLTLVSLKKKAAGKKLCLCLQCTPTCSQQA